MIDARRLAVTTFLVVLAWGLAAGAEDALQIAARPGAPAAKPAPAKAVIQVWLWGGPAHLDTFDPKPAAGYNYCGPLSKTIATNVPGVEINEALPLLAKQADKYAIIRSMTHGINGHETAAYMMQTGHKQGEGLVYPSLGAIVSVFKGYDHGYKSQIPPYVILTTPQGRFSEIGFLASKYKPFVTGGDPNQSHFAVEGLSAAGISEERQRDRTRLLHALDSFGKAMPGEQFVQQMERCEAKAQELMTGDAAKLFDLSTETDEVREAYGRNTFGQCCLMARRLVESGVRYVTINYKGWDTHKQHFEAMRRKLPEMDRGMATLLQDLADRKLLDSTIVWWGGEFGRTPKVQWEDPWNGGRGHYGKCFSVVLAGGGFKGGRVVGASDARGEEVAQRPVTPQDLLGSILELLGIDPDGPLPNPKGLDLKVMPSAAGGPAKGRLHEIMP
jgi:hypothetical protein